MIRTSCRNNRRYKGARKSIQRTGNVGRKVIRSRSHVVAADYNGIRPLSQLFHMKAMKKGEFNGRNMQL